MRESKVEVGVLGPLEVRREGEVLPIDTAASRVLIAVLAAAAPDGVSFDVLADRVWGDRAPAGHRKALQVQVARARRSLGADVIDSVPGGYRLGAALDVARFEAGCSAAGAALADERADDAVDLLANALAVWRGPAFADVALDVEALGSAAARLEERRVTAVDRLADAALECGRAVEVVEHLEAALDAHPLRECTAERLMVALYQSGRQADALRTYTGLRRRLAEELGIRPSPGLQDLEREILLQDPALATADDDGRSAAERLGRARRREAALPPDTSSFIGREVELDRVSRLLAESRLLTLTGPGGCGKSRLAIQAARAAVSDGAGRACFVDLAPVEEARHVPLALVDALGIQEDATRGSQAVLEDHLVDEDLVVVLDNCEHVVDAAATMVGHLLAVCPGLRVLATSRQRLGTQGEATWPVPMLTVPDSLGLEATTSEAVRLFSERAVAVAPDFTTDATNAADVVAICQALDGLPLAIELAAAWVRLLSPRQILDRLDDRFALLGAPVRGAGTRQPTLRAVVDWSHDLLDPTERRLFGRLSVFPGTFSLAAAEAVGGPQTLDALSGLVDKSLVQVLAGDESRYRLLETLRVYAAERLAEDPDGAVQASAAHLQHFLEIAETTAWGLRAHDDLATLARLDLDNHNLRAALAWGIDHDRIVALQLAEHLTDYWDQRSRHHDWLLATEAGLAAPVGTPGRAWAYAASAGSAYGAGDYDDVLRLGKVAVELAREEGNRNVESRAIYLAALTTFQLGDLATATAHADALAAFPWPAGPSVGLECQAMIALILHGRGEVDAAEALVRDGIASSRRSGDRAALIVGLHAASRMAVRRGDDEVSDRDLQEALELSLEAGLTRWAMLSLFHLSSGAVNRGELAVARAHVDSGVGVASELGNRTEVSWARWLAADVAHNQGDFHRARELLEIVADGDDALTVNAALGALAEMAWQDDDPAAARKLFADAARCGPEGARRVAEVGWRAMAHLAGDPVSVEELDVACDLLAATPLTVHSIVLAGAARAHASLGHHSRAVNLLAEAFDRDRLERSLPVDIRLLEEVALLTGPGDTTGSAALVLAATTAIRDRIGMARGVGEQRWCAEATAAAQAALSPAVWAETEEQAQAIEPMALIAFARELLTV